MKSVLSGLLIAASLLSTVAPASAQSIDFGPGGIRVDPRSAREREIDAIRREERRQEFREEMREERRRAFRREERRREFEEDGPPPRRY